GPSSSGHAFMHTPYPNSRIPRTGATRHVGVMKRSIVSAFVGALVWLTTPWLPLGTPPPVGSIEHLFLFWVLVAAPLAFALSATMLQPSTTRTLYCLARRFQPVASAMVLTSFILERGAVAGALASAWLVLGLLLLAGGLPRIPPGVGPLLSGV